MMNTPVSEVSILSGEVVDWRYKAGAVVSLEDAKAEAAIISDLMKAQQLSTCRLLIDIREIRSISRKARKFFASQEVHDTYGVQGLALQVSSPVSTMIGNLYLSFNRTLHPTRLFTHREAAMEWLLAL